MKRGRKFGHIVTKETRKKIRKNTKIAMANPAIVKKMRIAKLGKPSNHKGYKCTEEQIERMRKAHKGQIAWNKDRIDLPSPSQETIEKRKLKMMGKDNPAWKGGITPQNRKIRASVEMRLWREAVFARDNYTCQKYGIKGGKLVAHHIKNFTQFPELRFAIDNGITLSKKAHIEFHKKYGYKNNTKEQVEEFLLAVIKG